MQLKKLIYVLPFCGLLMTETSFSAPANEQAVNPKAGLTDALPCKDASSCGAWVLSHLTQGQSVMCRQGNALPWKGPIVVSFRSFGGQLCSTKTPIIGNNAGFKKVRALIAAYCMPDDQVGFNTSSSCGNPLIGEFSINKDGTNLEKAINEIFPDGKKEGTVATTACNLSDQGKFKGEAAEKIKSICNPAAK